MLFARVNIFDSLGINNPVEYPLIDIHFNTKHLLSGILPISYSAEIPNTPIHSTKITIFDP